MKWISLSSWLWVRSQGHHLEHTSVGVFTSGELMLGDCQQGLEGVYLTLQQLVLRGSQFSTQRLQ